MPDSDGKASAQPDESADTKSSRPASQKSVSKPGSAKSTARSGSGAKSPKAPKSGRQGSPKGKPKKSKKKEEEKEEAPPKEEDEAGLPEGVIPIFLASKTQEIFEVRCDEDVTTDNPYKLLKKEDLLQDLFNRAAICDFAPWKQQIQDYPGDEILICYDGDFKYGQNFYVALTEEGKNKILHPEGEEGVEGGAAGEPEEEVIYKYIPPTPKEWVHLGSDKEIQEESLIENRPKISMTVQRTRRMFGAAATFTDRNVADAKDCYVECQSYEDRTFDLKKMELTQAVQAIPEFVESTAQTDWKYPRNAAVQYEPRLFEEEERKKMGESPELNQTVEHVVPRFKLALQQNEIMDVFYDDWSLLGDDDGSFGSKADNHLKEYQSFTDLQFSKDKTITAIDWHPTIRGIVAVAAGEKMSYDDRIDLAHRVIMTPSLILIWSFADPIHPQLLLEAPDDILAFQFNPTDPNIIVGGCVNGQVVLWDISQHAEKLKAPRGGKKKSNINSLPEGSKGKKEEGPKDKKEEGSTEKKDEGSKEEEKKAAEEVIPTRPPRKSKWGIDEKKMAFAEFDGIKPGLDDENALDTPVVRYCAVSSIEHSHRAPITDVLWVPDHIEVNRMGIPHENRSGQCVQIMTCATDHPSLIRSVGNPAEDEEKKKKAALEAALAKKRAEEGGTSTGETGDDSLSLTENEQLERMPGTVLFWDTRPPKAAAHIDKKKEEMGNPMGVPNTFKHLDLSWKPHLKVSLSKSEPGGDHSPVKFSIQERQGDKSILNSSDDRPAEKKASDTMGGGFSFGASKPGSGGVKRTLSHVNTHFYVGSEDGEIVYVDWMPQKDQDSGKIQTPKPDYYHSMHDGQVVTLQRSPFFKDILLCVGGWSFTIWKEGLTSGPILMSAPSGKRLTSGHWSSSRPAVFYISRQDGSVDIWDLLDRTHEPSMNQSVSPAPITAIYPFQVTNKQHLLAVGDQAGTLHILEIPWSLRQPTQNEIPGVTNYFDREVKRRSFVMARWDFREKEKMELEGEKKRNAGIAPNVSLTDEEIEYRQKLEYQVFLDEESNFLRELGLKEEVEEPLPDVE